MLPWLMQKHLKVVSEIIKCHSTTLNIKMTRTYQNNFGKSKSAMETKDYMENYVSMLFLQSKQ